MFNVRNAFPAKKFPIIPPMKSSMHMAGYARRSHTIFSRTTQLLSIIFLYEVFKVMLREK